MKALKIKVCGITSNANLEELRKLPIDYFGFIHVASSPRFLKNPQELAALVPPEKRVLVTKNYSLSQNLSLAKEFNINTLQLHGEESVEDCAELLKAGLNLWKAFAIQSAADLHKVEAYAGSISCALLDHTASGMGTKFNWNLLNNFLSPSPYILAGGIGPEDRVLKIYPQMSGIDLNSRFEISPGIKDVQGLKFYLENLQLC